MDSVGEGDYILTGSASWFLGMPGFEPHDIDYLRFINHNENNCYLCYYHGYIKEIKKPVDLWTWEKHSPQDYINFLFLYDSRKQLSCASFLNRRFAKKIGFTIEHLKLIKILFDLVGYRHNYLKMIYQYYIENGDYVLTLEQLLNAYNDYKKYRK